jgi:hypothetical protein
MMVSEEVQRLLNKISDEIPEIPWDYASVVKGIEIALNENKKDLALLAELRAARKEWEAAEYPNTDRASRELWRLWEAAEYPNTDRASRELWRLRDLVELGE